MRQVVLKAALSGVFVVGGLEGLARAAAAGDTPPATQPSVNIDELEQRINSLETEVHQLKAQQQQDAQVQATQNTATMRQIQSDADLHSKLLDATGLDAGYAGGRFFIASDDGNFVLRPWIHVQIRDSTAYREADYDTQNGFEIRRARLGFDGNLFTPDFTYLINWATNRENSTLTVVNGKTVVGTTTSPVGGLPVLEEAWVKYQFHDTPFSIHIGQMHDPLDHENMIGSKFRAPEASLQGDLFGNTDTFTQAATFIYDNNGPFRFEGGVTDGMRAANTNFEDYPNNGVAYDGGVAGRFEYKVMGQWKDYSQLTALSDSQDLLVLGSGYDYSYGGSFYTLCHTADLQFGSPSGLFAYLCYFGRYTNHQQGIPLTSSVSASFDSSPSDLGKDTYEPSALVQVAYLIGGKFEPYVRYEYMHLQGTPSGSQNNVTDISLGFNYYFFHHNLKFTGQAMYLPTGIPINDDSSDVLICNDKGEVVIITQLQLLL